jgi:uncharacterized protein YeaO (DUF488 family)
MGMPRTPASKVSRVGRKLPSKAKHGTAAKRTKAVTVQVKRAYEPASRDDGTRVLVDRLWPRGMARENLKIDSWMRDLGPSDQLRKWFGHDAERWAAFRRRYRRELAAKKPLLEELGAQARRGTLTLVYSARDPVHNQAVVIKEVLERGFARASTTGARAGRP